MQARIAMITWRMRIRVMLLYLIPVAIIAIAVAIPNHIRTGDRRYDRWENVRTIVVYGSIWFIISAAMFRLCWYSGEEDSRDKANQRSGPRGFEVLPPITSTPTDDGGAKSGSDTCGK